jgi:TolA-binding protein
VVANKWPAHAKAPDALLNIATCQQELADAKGAKSTLEALLAKYPDSAAATTARQRLKK